MGSSGDPGPVDKSVLYDQENHISSAIWEGQVRYSRLHILHVVVNVNTLILYNVSTAGA